MKIMSNIASRRYVYCNLSYLARKRSKIRRNNFWIFWEWVDIVVEGFLFHPCDCLRVFNSQPPTRRGSISLLLPIRDFLYTIIKKVLDLLILGANGGVEVWHGVESLMIARRLNTSFWAICGVLEFVMVFIEKSMLCFYRSWIESLL